MGMREEGEEGRGGGAAPSPSTSPIKDQSGGICHLYVAHNAISHRTTGSIHL